MATDKKNQSKKDKTDRAKQNDRELSESELDKVAGGGGYSDPMVRGANVVRKDASSTPEG